MTTKPYKNENKPSDKVSEPIASYANPEKTSIIETYWGLLKNLSTDIKLKLIAFLTLSWKIKQKKNIKICQINFMEHGKMIKVPKS